jgi:hypothetical protein
MDDAQTLHVRAARFRRAPQPTGLQQVFGEKEYQNEGEPTSLLIGAIQVLKLRARFIHHPPIVHVTPILQTSARLVRTETMAAHSIIIFFVRRKEGSTRL